MVRKGLCYDFHPFCNGTLLCVRYSYIVLFSGECHEGVENASSFYFTCTVSLVPALTANAVKAVALVSRPWSSSMGIILP